MDIKVKRYITRDMQEYLNIDFRDYTAGESLGWYTGDQTIGFTSVHTGPSVVERLLSGISVVNHPLRLSSEPLGITRADLDFILPDAGVLNLAEFLNRGGTNHMYATSREGLHSHNGRIITFSKKAPDSKIYSPSDAMNVSIDDTLLGSIMDGQTRVAS